MIGPQQSEKFQKIYSEFFKEFKRVFTIHGGTSNLVYSPYMHLSVLLGLAIHTTSDAEWRWYNVAISVLPSLIGMSLTGYALILSFGSESFRDAIRGPSPDKTDIDGDHSPYIITSTGFAFFLTIQICSLLFAILCQAAAVSQSIILLIGLISFIYGLLLAIAAVMAAFFISRMYDTFKK